MSLDTDFPRPIRIKGRLYFAETEIEKYKHRIIAQALGCDPEPYLREGGERLIPAPQVAKEFGVSRRTIGRRIHGFEARAA